MQQPRAGDRDFAKDGSQGKVVMSLAEPRLPAVGTVPMGSVANSGAKEAKHEPFRLPIGVQAAITHCHT